MPPNRHIRSFYLTSIIVIGAAVFIDSMQRLMAAAPGPEWFLLAALTLLTGSFTVKLPTLSAKISVSETFVFTSVLLFGPSGGTITVVLDALVISLWMKREKRSATRVLFNATSAAIAIRLASEAFFALSGISHGEVNSGEVGALIAPLFAFAFLYFLINTLLIAAALGFERQQSIWTIWWTHFPPVSLTYFVGGSIALLIAAYTNRIDLPVISIIILPLLLISYLTFRTSMGRLDDATRHVSQLNELYMSTVEALAMAVDAKDQVTHGHIRRVQVYAVELAKRLGVAEGNQLKAIESAALLHDMGKLAIPEHILNKPGQLTSAEFGKMKRHADIGADLLSSIKFPYPVIPIVRHHHENWDGTGYPAGLAGADIPLGARILSVVDCFDALTSDRPYRPRLSPNDAFDIIRQRRGSMYDPLVVDTFMIAYAEIAPAANFAGEDARSLTNLAVGSEQPASLQDIHENAVQSAALSEYEQEMNHKSDLTQCLEATFQYLRQLTPASVCALFRHVQENDTLICIGTAGDPDNLLFDLYMKNGERITGWSFANDRTIANSRATLDLASRAELFTPTLRSALVTPLRNDMRRLGALSVYSIKQQPFTDDHKYVLERIAAILARRLDAIAIRAPVNGIVQFQPRTRTSPS